MTLESHTPTGDESVACMTAANHNKSFSIMVNVLIAIYQNN